MWAFSAGNSPTGETSFGVCEHRPASVPAFLHIGGPTSSVYFYGQSANMGETPISAGPYSGVK